MGLSGSYSRPFRQTQHTVPVLYDKYEDKIDPLAEKALIEFKKQYAVFDEKVLSKIPKGPLKEKKLA